MLTFDTETALIERGNPAPALVLASLAWDDGPIRVVPPGEGLETLEAALALRTPVLGQNLPYDLGVAIQERPDLTVPVIRAALAGLFYDTSILCAIVDIAGGYADSRPKHSLEALAKRLLGLDLHAVKTDPYAWRFRYAELLGVPRSEWPDSAVSYAAGDVEHTRAIWRILTEQTAPDLIAESVYQTGTAVCLRLFTLRGMRVDGAALDTIHQRCEAAAKGAEQGMRAEMLIRANDTRDMTAIKGRVRSAFEARGEEPPLTPSGQVSTSAETLVACGDPTLVRYALAGGDRKLLEGFLPRLQTRRGIVTPGYRLPATSGRAKGDLQNMPRTGGLRECLVARDGRRYVWGDYGQAELCALAQICLELFGASALADAINAGKDLHVLTACQLLGISPDQYDPADELHARTRQEAKGVNFGRPGGLGPGGLVGMAAGNGHSLSIRRAKELIAAHARAWPDVQRYLDWAYTEYRAQRPAIVRPSGRHRRSNSYTALCNTRFQGRVADGMHKAVRLVVSGCYDAAAMSPLWGVAWPVLDMHDEMVVECLEASADVVEEELRALMLEGMMAVIPDIRLRVDTHRGGKWGK